MEKQKNIAVKHFYYAADNVRVKNMMDGIEMSVSAENEEAYRSMILEAV